MDRACDDHERVAEDKYVDRASSESESEHGGSSVSITGKQAEDPNDLTPTAADDGGDDVDSDIETQRIGDSVFQFARRCVKTGEFAHAVTALMNVVEISDLQSVLCRQALLFAAQVFLVTNQETKALACMMELWDKMPPLYTTQDAQLLLAIIHERLEQPRFAVYWFKKAFHGSFPPSAPLALHAWLALARRSYGEGDFVLATEAYVRAFACIVFQTHQWPPDLCVFRFIGRFLTALTSVAHPRPDRQAYRQQIAFSLATVIVENDLLTMAMLRERVLDKEYLLLRRVYAASFPSIYEYLFREEDCFVGRIVRTWRLFHARQMRKRTTAERQRQQREANETKAEAVVIKSTATQAKKKKTTPLDNALPTRGDDRDEPQRRVLRQRTKARIQSLHASASPVKKKISSRLKPQHESTAEEPIASPTRRKLENVKRLRATTLAKPSLSETATQLQNTSENQRPTSGTSSQASLLDLYAFPTLATHRHAFEIDARRPQGPADIVDDELNEIEAFARMAHYRSRVLRHQHAPLQDNAARLDVQRITPHWLGRFNDVLHWMEAQHESYHFSTIHARVVMQLTEIHTTYRLQHGKTTFTIQLTKALRRLATWEFTSVETEILPQLRVVKTIGEREEAHRNLEFYHVQQQ